MSRFAACLLLLMLPFATAQEWTRFRGPDGAGLSETRGIPTSFKLSEAKWNVSLPGRGHSSPVVWGNRIFLTCEGTDAGRRWLVCLNAGDGTIAWKKEQTFESHKMHRFNSPASATPAVDAKRVYVVWSSGAELAVAAFDHSGGEVWSRKLGAFAAQHGSGTSPVIIDGVLVVGNDHEIEGSFLTGLEPATGKQVWQVPRTTVRASYATPIVHRGAGRIEAIFASSAHGITSLDPKTGTAYWEIGGFKQRCVGAPAIAAGMLFASAGSGGGGKESTAIRLPAKGKEPEAAYSVRRALPYVPCPLGVGDLFFLVGDGGVVTCVEAKSGEVVWRERLEGGFYSSPICIDGAVYALSRHGELFVLKAARKFEILGRVELGEPSSATPAVAGGVLYLRTDTRLIAVEAKRE